MRNMLPLPWCDRPQIVPRLWTARPRKGSARPAKGSPPENAVKKRIATRHAGASHSFRRFFKNMKISSGPTGGNRKYGRDGINANEKWAQEASRDPRPRLRRREDLDEGKTQRNRWPLSSEATSGDSLS
jgi:hypothetical protein